MFFEEEGRTLILRGVNLATAKFPRGCPSYRVESLNNAASCSYINTPFELRDAPNHLQKLQYLGFNALRLPIVWEALEHAGPGIYDDEYIDHIVELVRICVDYGFKVVIDPHQDLWSRYAGGSGAPLWTIHACGLDPDGFADTHAAVRYCDWPLDSEEKDPKSMPGMMWTTNNNRLATMTLFALFFAGRDFAPKCQIDGVNIQDYLQHHYLAAYSRLAERLGDLAFGYDSMNEPEPGYVGWKDLGNNDKADTAKIGSTPTPIEGMKLGMGMTLVVNDYILGKTGPHKSGVVEIQPKTSCWLKEEDARWKWNRCASWPLNTCVWAWHGVWDINSGALLKPEYFAKLPHHSNSATPVENKSEGQLTFLSSYWQEVHQKWSQMLRRHSSKSIIFLQPSVLATPPPREDRKTAYSPHFYDPLTIMHHHWHERWNADIVGLLRGKHKTKVSGLRIGRSNVRGVISKELSEVDQDLNIPTFVGELGIPFNLDDSKAYQDGDYSAHVKAMDAVLSGCDDHLLSYAIWDYCPINNHEWGDHWNGEDLSIYCSETGSFTGHPALQGFRAAAAWCRPFVQALTGQVLKMGFDYRTSVFTLEVKSEEEGTASVYVPWLHYRREEGLNELAIKVAASEGQWTLDRPNQRLVWHYSKGGRLRLERDGGALSAKELGTII